MREPAHPVPEFGTPDVAAIAVAAVPLCAICNDHGTITAADLLLPGSPDRGQSIQWTPTCAACAAGWDDASSWVGRKFALVPLPAASATPAEPAEPAEPAGFAPPAWSPPAVPQGVIRLRDQEARRMIPIQLFYAVAGHQVHLKVIDHRQVVYTEVVLTARHGALHLDYAEGGDDSEESAHRVTLIPDTAVLDPFEISAANRRDAEAVAVLHKIAGDSAEFRMLLGHAAAGIDITTAEYRHGLRLARSAGAQP